MFVDAGFEVKQAFTDKRLLVNRKQKKTMYRNWLQLQCVKPLEAPAPRVEDVSAPSDVFADRLD